VRYPKDFPGKRVVEDPIGFADLAPTILELTGTSSEGMLPISGRSILNILQSEKQGVVDDTKEYVLAGRERHSSSRYLNWGYPQRFLRYKEFIYIWNVESNRWPAGAPQRYNPKDSTKLWPLYGLNENGKFMGGGAFTDIDDCPSKTYIIENYEDQETAKYFELAHGKRSEYELYNVTEDPYCLNNLAGDAEHASIEKSMKEKLMRELQRSKDPRVVGPDKEVFDSYIRYSHMRQFPEPEWAE
jgi:uncharacterized sulfatase